MKRFTFPCQFGEATAPFALYVGEPVLEPEDVHPLEQQAAWLLRERGGVIPEDVMSGFMELRRLAKAENVSFEELCVYALGTVSGEGGSAADAADAARA